MSMGEWDNHPDFSHDDELIQLSLDKKLNIATAKLLTHIQ